MENRGTEEIEAIRLLLIGTNEEVVTVDLNSSSLASGGVKKFEYNYDYGVLGELDLVEFIPKIKVEGDVSIQSAIRGKLSSLTDREAMVRVKISGFVPRKVIDSYRREDILKEYEGKYFLFVLDDADLLPQEEKIPAVKFTSPGSNAPYLGMFWLAH